MTASGEDTTYITYSHLQAEDKILFAKYKKGSVVKESMYVDGPGIDDHLFEISGMTEPFIKPLGWSRTL